MSAPKFTTLGCRLNAYESEAMRELATAAGLSNVQVINTCAVTAEAVRKAKKEIRKLARENPNAPIIVTGCAAQTEPETFAAMAEVTRVVGNQKRCSQIHGRASRPTSSARQKKLSSTISCRSQRQQAT